jgi:cytochrome c biogenesis protein CcmG/thiol:disulfide interchange protein DsbE
MPGHAHSAKAPPDRVTTALVVAGLVLGVALVPRLFAGTFAATQGALVGKPAPAFSLPVIANATPGQTAIALTDLKGNAVILDFWATWCGPCRAEAPIVNSVANRFRDRGLTVVGINTSDRAGLGGPWALAHHLDYPIAFDTGSEAAADYGVTAMPTLVVISRTGNVIAVREGMTDADELESLVKKAL